MTLLQYTIIILLHFLCNVQFCSSSCLLSAKKTMQTEAERKQDETIIKQDIELAPTQEEEVKLETQAQINKTIATPSESFWYLGLLAGITTHGLTGLHPVFSRYLQHMPVPFPPLLLLGAMNSITLLVLCPRLLLVWVRKLVSLKKQHPSLRVFAQQCVFQDLIKNWLLWIFAINFIIRSVTNILASKYAQGIYVQLIALAIPFMTTIMAFTISKLNAVYYKYIKKQPNAQVLFADETVNWKTLVALVITCKGGALIILGGVGKTEHWYDFATSFKFYNLENSEFSGWDVLGMFFSFLSSLAFTLYMLLLRYAKTKKMENEPLINLNDGGIFHVLPYHIETVFFVQMIVLALLLIPSAIFESWSVFLHMALADWCIFLAFTFCVFLIGTACNIFAIRHLGATTAGSLLTLRLITAIIAGVVILQENIKSIWPFIGTIVVIIGISYFMYCKRLEAAAAT